MTALLVVSAVTSRCLGCSFLLLVTLLDEALLVLLCVFVLMGVVALGIRLGESGRGQAKEDGQRQKANANRSHGLTIESNLPEIVHPWPQVSGEIHHARIFAIA